jgi:cardiolipin synthase
MQALQVAGIVVLALFLLICVFAGFGHLTRGTPIERVRSLDDSGPPPVSSDAFCDLIQLAASAALHEGNRIEILANGDGTYPRLWADLRSARETITLQLYYCQPGKLADELKEILNERARAGVKVMFLRDAFGSQKLKKEYLAEMTDAGVLVCTFRPTHWYQLHKAQHRSHIRVVVVDGRVAYTGGFGIDDKWMGDGRTGESWRETNVRFTGPAVAQHQATFVTGWAEAAGDLLTGNGLFPSGALSSDAGKAAPAAASRDAANEVLAASVHCAPTVGSTVSERLLALTICCAQRTLYIANAYFVPDDDFRRMLVEAVKRGVDVRVLTAGPLIDTKLTWHASHARYEELLSGGVRIFEYQPTMMHAKTVTVDGIWSIVGTMNFDNRSFALNDESVLMTHDGRVASTIERHYLDDLTLCKEITLAEWRKRPLLDRVKERGATLFSRLL